VSVGHAILVLLKLLHMIKGDVGDVERGGLVTWEAWVLGFAMNAVCALLLLISSTHSAAQKTPLHGCDIVEGAGLGRSQFSKMLGTEQTH
jgi:hypothetical protein